MAVDFGKLSLVAGVLMWAIDKRQAAQQAQLQAGGQPPAQQPRALPPGPQRRVGARPSPQHQPPPQEEETLPPPLPFSPAQVAQFTAPLSAVRDLQTGRAFGARVLGGTPGVSGGLVALLSLRSAVPAPSLLEVPPEQAECWQVVPLQDGAPQAGALVRARLEAGLSALGSHSLVLLQTGSDAGMFLVFCAPELARPWSMAPGQFAVVAEAAPEAIDLPAPEAAEETLEPAEVQAEATPDGDAVVTASDVASDGASTELADPQPGVALANIFDAAREAAEEMATEVHHQNGASTRIALVPVDVAPPPTSDAE